MRFLAFLFIVLLLPALAFAGPIEDGMAAFNQGDYQTALKLWQPLADKGNPEAENKLGIFYEFSQPRFRQPDNAEAMRWFRKAAEQGNIEAQVNLGGMYANGIGIKKDGAKALKWWLRAAKQGDEWAQVAVGNCYVSDMCGKQNPEEAVKWYRKAAEQRSSRGAYGLFKMYRDGRGVKRDYKQAYMWCEIAYQYNDAPASSRHGYELSRECVKVANKMNKEQIAEAKRLIAEWKPPPAPAAAAKP